MRLHHVPGEAARSHRPVLTRGGDAYDERYDKGLAALEQAVLDWLEEHPELRTEENTEDMWSYRDPEEDTDDENEEDDW